MTEPSFKQALREADDALRQVGVPDGLGTRIRSRIHRPSRLIRVWMASAVAVAAIGLVIWVEPPERPLGFELAQASPDMRYDVSSEQLVVRSGRLTLRDEELVASIDIGPGGVISRERDGVRVASGIFVFRVGTRHAGHAPFAVHVAAGRLLVHGTHFTVTVRERGGDVTLHSGALRFVAKDGHEIDITPGETLVWPRKTPDSAVTNDQPTPDEPEPPPIPRGKGRQKGVDLPDILERVAALRSRGRYTEAVRELRAALAQPMPVATRERLSFEIGTILVRHLGDERRACEHWRAHEQSFPRGRYRNEVACMMMELGCTD